VAGNLDRFDRKQVDPKGGERGKRRTKQGYAFGSGCTGEEKEWDSPPLSDTPERGEV